MLQIGLDEAGRGSLCGRVYAAAVVWDDTQVAHPLVRDSKKLSAKQRTVAFEWILQHCPVHGIGYATAEEIDQTNIVQATALAMRRALEHIGGSPATTCYLFDGLGWKKYFSEFPNMKCIVRGESQYLSIAAASILAKVSHDRHIESICALDPTLDAHYGLLKNMGYGTRTHCRGIQTHGLSSEHRKTFTLKKEW
jgi:ribonuclease HII